MNRVSMQPHLPARNTRARARSREGAGGFTLIELTVSLGAGLVVAIGVVGLSKTATNSFHEEIRSAAAESGARTAIDRIRADLQRASFMSTGNVRSDPMIAKAPGALNISTTAASAFPALARLAGVHLFVGGSAAATPLSAAQTPKLNPDAIEIAGNFTTTDQFVVRNIDPATGGACQRVWLAMDSPPMWRILGTERSADGGAGGTAGAADANLANAFAPAAGKQFFVRVADDTGHFQYVVTCATPTGGASLATPQPWLDIDPKTPILTTQQTQTIGGAGGLGVGRITVNPIQVVRYELTGTLPAALAALNSLGDATKYDLIRSYVDASGAVVPSTTEVIAEYAIDLKFAVTVDTGETTGLAPALTTVGFDDDTNNALAAPDVTTMTMPFTRGPQRIRSMRVRLVTRAALSDRRTPIAVAPPNAATQTFLYRYCAGQLKADGGLPNCNPATNNNASIYARARTVTSEVSLPNQARMYFL